MQNNQMLLNVGFQLVDMFIMFVVWSHSYIWHPKPEKLYNWFIKMTKMYFLTYFLWGFF